jgi:hypothetical protein
MNKQSQPLNILYKLSIFTLFFISAKHIHSQEGFKGYITFGLNAAQIDGDAMAGFNKVGPTGGVGVKYSVHRLLDLGMEFLYSPRGGKNYLFSSDVPKVYIDLKYAELPVYICFKDWYIEEENYHKVGALAGLSYGTLLSSSSNVTLLSDKVAQMKNNDFTYFIGGRYMFTKHIGLTARYNRSFAKVYNNTTLPNDYFLGYFWSARVEYYF